MTPKKKLPLKRALTWILVSTLLISGSTGLGILYYFHIQELQISDEKFAIQAIDDRGQKIGAEYLAEMLGLHENKKVNLFLFNTDEAKEKLMSCPVIDTAKIKKIKPSTLAVDYHLRNPSFKILDVSNTAIDRQGKLFPIEPFFGEVSIPEIYLGCTEETISWGKELKDTPIAIAFELLEQGREMWLPLGLQLKKVDVSRVNFSSYGGREVILILKDSNEEQWVLRLNIPHRHKQLANFLKLRSYLLSDRELSFPVVIDLRIPGLAYVQLEN